MSPSKHFLLCHFGGKFAPSPPTVYRARAAHVEGRAPNQVSIHRDLKQLARHETDFRGDDAPRNRRSGVLRSRVAVGDYLHWAQVGRGKGNALGDPPRLRTLPSNSTSTCASCSRWRKRATRRLEPRFVLAVNDEVLAHDYYAGAACPARSAGIDVSGVRCGHPRRGALGLRVLETRRAKPLADRRVCAAVPVAAALRQALRSVLAVRHLRGAARDEHDEAS